MDFEQLTLKEKKETSQIQAFTCWGPKLYEI